MDAFSVSLANGLQEPYMKKRKMTLIAGVFGFFQFAMPFIGWICVNMLIDVFQFLWPLIPWISLILLCAIGGFMIKDGLTGEEEAVHPQVHMKALFLQGLRPPSTPFPSALRLRNTMYPMRSLRVSSSASSPSSSASRASFWARHSA